MTTITNVNQLPPENVHTFLVEDKAAAEKKATQYANSWYYESIHVPGLAYLYVLQSEWESKQVMK